MISLPIVFHPLYDLKMSQASRFPIQKYSQLKKKLEIDGILKKRNLFVPLPLSLSIISRTHDPLYVNRVHSCSLSEILAAWVVVVDILSCCWAWCVSWPAAAVTDVTAAFPICLSSPVHLYHVISCCRPATPRLISPLCLVPLHVLPPPKASPLLP